jgi:dihydroorotate dehydrogenase electron transfer subunit
MKATQFTAPLQPTLHEDGTLTARITYTAVAAESLLLSVALPAGLSRTRLAGRYFLVRCGDASSWGRSHDWAIYLRRPLFVAGWRAASEAAAGERWLLTTPLQEDAGVAWLAARAEQTAVNLLGPLGNGFMLPPRVRQLAVVSTPARVAALLPLVHELLDRGGRVVILLQSAAGGATALREQLPFAAEVQQAAPGPAWAQHLAQVVAWADVVAAALPGTELPGLVEAVRGVRLRVEQGFAQVLVDARLVCGYGACHACVTPLGNGRWTRACVHGPVFDLADLGR